MLNLYSKQMIGLMLVGSLSVLLTTPSAETFAQEQSQPILEQQVNINEADAKTIADALVGVGAAKATAIVEFREEHGPFTSVDQLLDVTGIGESTLATNRHRISLE